MENLQISALNMVGIIINEEEKSKGADKGLLALPRASLHGKHTHSSVARNIDYWWLTAAPLSGNCH